MKIVRKDLKVMKKRIALFLAALMLLTVPSALAAKKGVDPEKLGRVSGEEHKQQQYDILAATMRAHMDMKKIYEILEAGI